MEVLKNAVEHAVANHLAGGFEGPGFASAPDTSALKSDDFLGAILEYWDDFSAGEFLKKIEKFQA
jgi:hypothetical protein